MIWDGFRLSSVKKKVMLPLLLLSLFVQGATPNDPQHRVHWITRDALGARQATENALSMSLIS